MKERKGIGKKRSADLGKWRTNVQKNKCAKRFSIVLLEKAKMFVKNAKPLSPNVAVVVSVFDVQERVIILPNALNAKQKERTNYIRKQKAKD